MRRPLRGEKARISFVALDEKRPEPDRLVVGAAEVAKFTGIKPVTVRRRIERGELDGGGYRRKASDKYLYWWAYADQFVVPELAAENVALRQENTQLRAERDALRAEVVSEKDNSRLKDAQNEKLERAAASSDAAKLQLEAAHQEYRDAARLQADAARLQAAASEGFRSAADQFEATAKSERAVAHELRGVLADRRDEMTNLMVPGHIGGIEELDNRDSR